jgi:hypothetical protein
VFGVWRLCGSIVVGMSMVGAGDSGHLIVRFCAGLHVALDGVLGVPAWSMTAGEQRRVLVELARAEARVSEVRLRVLAAADRGDVGAESGAASTAAWVAHATRQVRSVADAQVRFARLLDGGFGLTREALAAGRVDGGQARVIVAAVQRLPSWVGSGVRGLAEQHLLELAGCMMRRR